MSKLKKAEPGHWEAFRVRLEGEVAWLTANASNGDALKKKGLDEDMAKRKIEIYSKLVKVRARSRRHAGMALRS